VLQIDDNNKQPVHNLGLHRGNKTRSQQDVYTHAIEQIRNSICKTSLYYFICDDFSLGVLQAETDAGIDERDPRSARVHLSARIIIEIYGVLSDA
jgi:hypothetical protein